LGKKSQKDVNIRAIVRQMADVEACGANLRRIIPKQIAISRIAGCATRIGFIKEQIG
jgi:hypothetical protein